MNATSKEWQRRHDELIGVIDRQRHELAGLLRGSLEKVEDIEEKSRTLKRTLPFLLLPAALLVALRPRRVLGWLLSGWAFYRRFQVLAALVK